MQDVGGMCAQGNALGSPNNETNESNRTGVQVPVKRSARYGYNDKMMRCENAESPCCAENDLVTSAENVGESNSNENE